MTGMKFNVLAQVGLSLIALISSIGFCHESLIFASEPPQETQVKIISNPKHPAPPDGKKRESYSKRSLRLGPSRVTKITCSATILSLIRMMKGISI